MDKQTSNLTNIDHWIRLIYMAILALLFAVARVVIWIVAALQFLTILFTGEGNRNLRNLGQGVSKWCYQAILYLTFNSDQKPFPFDDWPEIDEPEPLPKPQDEPVEDQGTVADVSVDDIPSFTKAPEGVNGQDDEVKGA